MSKRVAIVLCCVLAAMAILTLSACSVEVYDVELKGVNVVFTPVVAMWCWFWKSFTPAFWKIIESTFAVLPEVFNVIVGVLTNILGAALYLVILAIFLIIAVFVCILTVIGFFLAAIANGIFHFM